MKNGEGREKGIMAETQWKDRKEEIKQAVLDGNEKDLAGQICEILYRRDSCWVDLSPAEEIKRYVRKKYRLELDREYKEKQLQKLKKNSERGLHVKRKLERGIIPPLFTNILEEGKGFDQEEYNRNKRFDIYYGRIHQNFASYYEDIGSRIMETAQFFKNDLNYILLQELSAMTEEIYQVGDKRFLEWEEMYIDGKNILKIPEIDTGDKNRYLKKLLKEIEKVLQERTGFPVKFKSYVDMEKECLCIQKTDVKIQLALLFYQDFRKCFTNHKKPGEHDFIELHNMIWNIDEISVDEEEIDAILFPWLIERVTGLNLCIGYAEYYAAFKRHSEWNREVERHLNYIFDYFSQMPNVFSRIQMMIDFMDSILLFNKEIKRQLAIVENVVKGLSGYYQNTCNEIAGIVKKEVKDEDLKTQYLCGVKEACRRIGVWRDIYGAEDEMDYVFIKQPEEWEQDSDIYKKFQRRYIKNFKQIL